MNYKQTCIDFIKDNLDNWKDEVVEACDLGSMLSESENANGSWYCSTYKAEQDLEAFGRSTISDFIDEYKSEFGDRPQYDAYVDAESFHCLMMIMGVEKTLNETKTIQDSWNEKIKLTKKVINQIIEELE